MNAHIGTQLRDFIDRFQPHANRYTNGAGNEAPLPVQNLLFANNQPVMRYEYI